MVIEAQFRVQEADRVGDGILITFADGKSAIYPGALLRGSFAAANEILEDEDEA